MTTPATIQRKYALMKIEAGDYLLPSNDAKTLYRISSYVDGPSFGIEDWPRDVTLWGTWLFVGSSPDTLDPFDDDQWRARESSCETRAEAIQSALAEAERVAL